MASSLINEIAAKCPFVNVLIYLEGRSYSMFEVTTRQVFSIFETKSSKLKGKLEEFGFRNSVRILQSSAYTFYFIQRAQIGVTLTGYLL